MLFLSAASWSIFISGRNVFNTSGTCWVNEASTLNFCVFSFLISRQSWRKGILGGGWSWGEVKWEEKLLSRRVSCDRSQERVGTGNHQSPGSRLLVSLRKKTVRRRDSSEFCCKCASQNSENLRRFFWELPVLLSRLSEPASPAPKGDGTVGSLRSLGALGKALSDLSPGESFWKDSEPFRSTREPLDVRGHKFYRGPG